MYKNKKIIEFSPTFFDIILGGNEPDPKYVLSPYLSKPSKGWSNLSPKTHADREALYNKCGPDCFLDPSHLKYPICSKQNDCKRHCAGILSAKIRASQWKEHELVEKTNQLLHQHCY